MRVVTQQRLSSWPLRWVTTRSHGEAHLNVLSGARLTQPTRYRMVRQVRAKRRLQRELLSALPYGLFVIVWAIGEMVGYLRGTGDALAKIE